MNALTAALIRSGLSRRTAAELTTDLLTSLDTYERDAELGWKCFLHTFVAIIGHLGANACIYVEAAIIAAYRDEALADDWGAVLRAELRTVGVR